MSASNNCFNLKGDVMSKCVYSKAATCVNKARCQYKQIERDGRISCRKGGEITDADIRTDRDRPIKE